MPQNWNDKLESAQKMLPLIHKLHHTNNVVTSIFGRLLIDAGKQVHYVQNITDVDDPLFERAARDGLDWRELGTDQINLFRNDMEALSVIPPQEYVGAMESVDEVVHMVQQLLDVGAAYVVDDA